MIKVLHGSVRKLRADNAVGSMKDLSLDPAGSGASESQRQNAV